MFVGPSRARYYAQLTTAGTGPVTAGRSNLSATAGRAGRPPEPATPDGPANGGPTMDEA